MIVAVLHQARDPLADMSPVAVPLRRADSPMYNHRVTRKILVIGLILVAALLPMAAGPVAIAALCSIVVFAAVTAVLPANQPLVPFLRLDPSRAPPSR